MPPTQEQASMFRRYIIWRNSKAHNLLAVAELRAGDVVLDLRPRAGIDVLLSAVTHEDPAVGDRQPVSIAEIVGGGQSDQYNDLLAVG
jgi:hypothetical protein